MTTIARAELAHDAPAPGVLGLAERGLVPDALLRQGIRRMCAQRLAEECEGGLEAQSRRYAELIDSLRTSVRRRMVADVPVGVLLSGGVGLTPMVSMLEALVAQNPDTEVH